MDQYEILKTRYRIGHPLFGTVVGYEKEFRDQNLVWVRIRLKVEGVQDVWLYYDDMFDGHDALDEALLPPIGQRLKVVVRNYVDGTLFVSSKPRDLKEEAIQMAQDYYRYVDEMKEGMAVQGTVEMAVHYGLYVDIGVPFLGLIDLGYGGLGIGKPLPGDPQEWPKVGETIHCVMVYFRLHEYRFGMVWKPE